MSYQLKYTRTFEKQIEKLKKKDRTLMEETAKRVEKLQDAPYTGKALKYELNPYRSIRVKGRYRLVYKVNDAEKDIILVAFGHRKEIYKLMMLLREE
ncbi:MAG: type II toxin-antitoxin system RelE/ParE family toxin [Methanomicrobia archaeon]|nr:type II toxin-antitoxin system RelE/ParE family toxin [Methanomicrobia archaeon]